MSALNEFRLSQESAILFVLSYEYNIPFAKMLAMYQISDKIFWAYLSLFSSMSKMGVRKGSQLAKMANRLYKYVKGIKEKVMSRIEIDVVDDNGNLVYDDKGKVMKERKTKVEIVPIVLTETEQNIMDVMYYFITTGYSDGENFLTDEEAFDKRALVSQKGEVVKIDDVTFNACTYIEFLMEKYFPEMSIPEYRMLSVKDIGNMLSKVLETEEAIDETRV